MAQINKSKIVEKKSQENLTASTAVVDKAKSQKKHDMEMVKGVFRFAEVPGGTLDFTFGKHKGTNKNYSLVDGEVYSIPRCVASHLISTGSYPVHEYQTNAAGVPVVRIGRKKRRYSFDSLEFFDDLDSRESGLVTIENM